MTDKKLPITYTINPAIVALQTNLPMDLCNAIRNQYGPVEKHEASVKYWDGVKIAEQKVNPERRSTKISWVKETEWVAGMIGYYIDKINDNHFGYDLSGGISGNSYQYTVYHEGDFYDWHNDETRNLYKMYMDDRHGVVRKLSFSLQLSDPSEYDGGELVFMDEDDNEISQPKTAGTLVVFDSRQFHKVYPVTRGIRHALVGWYMGPIWK